MTADRYFELKAAVAKTHQHDLDWCASRKPPGTPECFALEYIYVVINSGMRFKVATLIYDRVIKSLQDFDQCTKEAFGHVLKRRAINSVWAKRKQLFEQWKRAEHKMAFLVSLPFIGPITQYHLAKNFGVDCFKPDRHIVRIAWDFQQAPKDFMTDLSKRTGDNLAMVDMVLWRAAEQGMI